MEVSENSVLSIEPDVHVVLTADSVGNKGKLYMKGVIVDDGGYTKEMRLL